MGNVGKMAKLENCNDHEAIQDKRDRGKKRQAETDGKRWQDGKIGQLQLCNDKEAIQDKRKSGLRG